MNLLEEEPLILARLRARIPDPAIAIASVASIVGTVNITPLCPALFLQPGGAEIAPLKPQAHAMGEDRQWTLIAALGHVPDPKGLASTYQEAGELLGLAHAALVGWCPGEGFGHVHYAGRDEPVVSAGYIEFPIRFTVLRAYTVPGV
jgi:hypothetical protein